jgi:hypothetical protein
MKPLSHSVGSEVFSEVSRPLKTKDILEVPFSAQKVIDIRKLNRALLWAKSRIRKKAPKELLGEYSLITIEEVFNILDETFGAVTSVPHLKSVPSEVTK